VIVALPTWIVVRAYCWRGARLWLAVRAAVSAVLLVGQTDPRRLSPSSTLLLLGVIVAVAFVDARRHRETVFVANLGIHPAVFALMLGAPALLGEILIRSSTALIP
jgi:hypothetical protein